MKLFVCYGRFNPPTISHRHLFELMAKDAGKYDHVLIACSSSSGPNNPLSVDEKSDILKQVVPKGAEVTFKYSSPFNLIESLRDEFEEIIIYCGSDRTSDYDRLQNYSDKAVTVVTVKRNNVSSTALRQAATQGDLQKFLKYYGGPDETGETIFNIVKERAHG